MMMQAVTRMQDGRMFLSPTLFSTFSQQCRAPILLYLGSSGRRVPSIFQRLAWDCQKPIRFLWKSLACVSRADPRRCRPRREQPARRLVGSTSTVRWWSIDWWPSSIRHPLRANPGGPPLPDASFTAKVGKSNLFGCAHSPQTRLVGWWRYEW